MDWQFAQICTIEVAAVHTWPTGSHWAYMYMYITPRPGARTRTESSTFDVAIVLPSGRLWRRRRYRGATRHEAHLLIAIVRRPRQQANKTTRKTGRILCPPSVQFYVLQLAWIRYGIINCATWRGEAGVGCLLRLNGDVDWHVRCLWPRDGGGVEGHPSLYCRSDDVISVLLLLTRSTWAAELWKVVLKCLCKIVNWRTCAKSTAGMTPTRQERHVTRHFKTLLEMER